MQRWQAGLAALVLAAALAGCTSSGQPAETVTVVAEGMTYAPKEITLVKGQPVKLVFQNKDSMLHDLSIDKIDANVKEGHGADHGHGHSDADLHVAADAGKSGDVIFTPKEEGTYTFYCTVAGHKEAGMVGTLIVKGAK
jgi:uncharacterized cupredoxin-like copper-binding protein